MFLLVWVCLARLAQASDGSDAGTLSVTSPNERIVVEFSLDNDRSPTYSVTLDGAEVVKASRLGLYFASRIDLVSGFDIDAAERTSVDTRWEQPWGERRLVRDHHNELLVKLVARSPGRQLNLRFRVFDDGVGFRYEVPEQATYSRTTLVGERSEFRVDRDARAFAQPASGELRYEHLYTEMPIGLIDLATTPLTLRLDSGVHLAIHEAALVNYPAFSLEFDVESILRTELRPSSTGYRAILDVPFVTPWRTVQIAESAVGLANSSLVLNLNEPNVLEQTDWIEPGKYVGIWWAMHLGQKTWGQGERHGATTADARRYIDFAADHGFDGVLVEGWNTGWDGDWVNNSQFSFVEAYPDFDIEAVAAYARERGVRLIGHHETGGHASDYETAIDDAFALYESLGVRQVKTGYVGKARTVKRRDEDGEVHLEWHDSQFAVNHYQRVVEAAARHRIAINTHEPVKDTGLRRTWPNWLTREGSRGMEFAVWGETSNPPHHEPMLAFTRMLAGPMDYTPGIFDLELEVNGEERRVQTTLAKQLALYVVIFSPIHMVPDLPENYLERPDAFQFIVDVPTDWEQSRSLAGAVGEYIVTARQVRGGKDWFLGAITNEYERRLSIDLDFLDAGITYVADIYADGADAHWESNPYAMEISTREVSSEDTLELRLAAGGGAAIRFRPATAAR
jgi:alpha-glucosidase